MCSVECRYLPKYIFHSKYMYGMKEKRDGPSEAGRPRYSLLQLRFAAGIYFLVYVCVSKSGYFKIQCVFLSIFFFVVHIYLLTWKTIFNKIISFLCLSKKLINFLKNLFAIIFVFVWSVILFLAFENCLVWVCFGVLYTDIRYL